MSATNKVVDYIRTPVFSVPEAAVLFGSGAAIPFTGSVPALGAGLGAVALSRATRSPTLSRYIPQAAHGPVAPLILGGLAGFYGGKQLTRILAPQLRVLAGQEEIVGGQQGPRLMMPIG